MIVVIVTISILARLPVLPIPFEYIPSHRPYILCLDVV